jgi:hypothetical protein
MLRNLRTLLNHNSSFIPTHHMHKHPSRSLRRRAQFQQCRLQCADSRELRAECMARVNRRDPSPPSALPPPPPPLLLPPAPASHRDAQQNELHASIGNQPASP